MAKENDEKQMKENDHKRLGRELGLFTFSDTVGKGLPLFTHKGAAIRRELERFIVDEEVRTKFLNLFNQHANNVQAGTTLDTLR